jgi:Transglycosylase SLT domain
MTALGRTAQGVRHYSAQFTQAFFAITHNGLAMLGIVLAIFVITLTARPDLRQTGEVKLMQWLQTRCLGSSDESEVDLSANDRALAADPKDLPKQQAALAYWLSRKYRIAPEPLSALVAAAFDAGKQMQVEPALILAVMAIESGFNPFAQSPVGAQGLMQVMTKVHTDKYENFGGQLAAFDPLSNLHVGVKILKECVARAGSVEGGLKQYVGATTDEDGGYALRVMAERDRLLQVAAGRAVPINTSAAPSASPSRQTPDTDKVALLTLH